MISLKRNDKIIIIVAIIVIVIAGIGVAMYTQPATTSIPLVPIGTNQSFSVNWTTLSGSLDTMSEFAGKKAPYITGIQIPQANIKSITFNMSWVDDHTTFFGRRGLDTMTLEVTTPDGEVTTVSNVSAPKTKQGSVSIMLVSNIIPPVTPIKADDVGAAQAQLNKKPYYDDSWMNRNFSIKVSDKIGEIRPLARLMDKGNSFSLQVSYQYYQGVIQQGQMKSTGGDGNDTQQTENIWEPPYMSMIISTGCGRFV